MKANTPDGMETIQETNPKLPPLPEKLKSTFCLLYGQASTLLQANGEIRPVAFFFLPKRPQDKKAMVVPMMLPPFGTDNEKEFVAALLWALGKKFKAEAMLTILEAWSLAAPKEVKGMTKEQACEWFDQNRPSLSPDRIEVVMFNLEHRGVGMYSAMAKITRDENDVPSIPETPPEFIDGQMDGRFANLLSDAQYDDETMEKLMENDACRNLFNAIDDAIKES